MNTSFLLRIGSLFLLTILVGLLCVSQAAAQSVETLALEELAKPGRMLMLRHAHAPGTGDPSNFSLADCATQRNLDPAGRTQAQTLGRRLAQAGVRSARIYSSAWCRCLETAERLELGPVEAHPGLNSFFGRPEERESTLAVLREFLAQLPLTGPPVILVTHQVTISALTGQFVASGRGALFELNETGFPRFLGLIQPD